MRARKWLIKLRGKFTQDEVATAANISRSAYSNIELGIRDPSVAMAKKISKALSFEWQLFFEQKCAESKQKRSKQTA